MHFAIGDSVVIGDGDQAQNLEPTRCASVSWRTISDFDSFWGFGGENSFW